MIEEYFIKILRWREKNISERHFVIFLSLLTGFFCAIAAHILKSIVDLLHELVKSYFTDGSLNYLYLATPIIGVFLASTFVRRVVKDDISHGVTKIMFAISQRKARIKSHNTWSSIIASSLTIGFGGSVGAEAPIVLTGSAIGSNLGQLFRMEQKTLMLLVGCGAAGAVAGIFKAPIAGVCFTLEVLMLDLTMASIVPLLISAATASVFTYLFSSSEAMFTFEAVPFTLRNVPFYILLGVLCGFVSLYFTRGMTKLESFFGSLNTPFKKLFVGGTMLSILIFFIPPLYGEGYDTIGYLLSGNVESIAENSVFYDFRDNYWMMLLFLFLIIFFKIFASAATNGSGGTGGIFAPSLFMGCITGFTMAYINNNVLHISALPEKNFALAGMAGVMAGVMHAPLTGAFLIAELTGGYDLFICLMITSTVAYVTILTFEPHSLYAMRLAKKGELLTHNTDKNILTLLKTENVIETDFQTLHPEMYLGDVIKIVANSNRNIFPVLDSKRRLVGHISLNEIRNIMFRPELYKRFKVSKLMVSPADTVSAEDPMERVMYKFEKTKAWNLPVLDAEGKYMGYVSKSKIFSHYRDLLVTLSDE